MANAFDRFDVPAQRAPEQPTGNAFDAFDQPTAQPVADPAPKQQGLSTTRLFGVAPIESADYLRQPAGQEPEQEYDSFTEATGKSLQNVPERFQQSFGGLVQMLGEDMDQSRERHMQMSAQRLGITPNEYKALAWAGQEGLIDPKTPIPEALESLKSRMATELTPEQQQVVADMGIINPRDIAQAGEQMRRDAQSTMVPVNAEPGSLESYGSAAIASIAEMTPALLASAVTRNPAVGMSIIGGQVSGESYGTGRDKGLNVDESQRYAAAQAAAEAIPEYLPISRILKPGTNFFRKMFETGVAESVQEGVTAALQAGIDKGTINPDMTWAEARGFIGDSMIVGGLAGPGMAAMTEPLVRMRNRDENREGQGGADIELPEAASGQPATTNPFDQFDQPASSRSAAEAAAETGGGDGQPFSRNLAAVPQTEPAPAEPPVISDEPPTDPAFNTEAVPEQQLEPAAEITPEATGTAVQAEPDPIAQAATVTDLNPTEAQKEAGNYRKAKIRLNGMEIAIENPRGSTRSGTDPDGNRWESTMAHHYGDIKGTKAADGDNLDVFIGPEQDSDQVFVVDQVNKDGSFDEHKVLMNFADEQSAREGYLANYEDGWTAGPITTMSMDEFKAWVKDGDTTKPLAGQAVAPIESPRKMDIVSDDAGKVDINASAEALGPVPQGYTRLYRASSPTVGFEDVFEKEGLEQFQRGELKGKRYTNDPSYAEYFRSTYGNDATIEVRDVASESLKGQAVNDYEFIVDDENLRANPVELEGEAESMLDQETASASFSRGSDRSDPAQQVKALADRLESELGLEQAMLSYRKSRNTISVDNIIVPRGQRGSGAGSRAMEAITSLADTLGSRVVLTPGLRDDRHGTTSRARLVRFYKRFGFVENKGRNKDFEISESMYRDPQDANYRRAQDQRTGSMSKARAESAIDGLMKGWKGAPKVNVAESISEFPKGLRDSIRAAQAESDMRAAFWNDEVYVLAPRIPNRQALEEVILHEVVGHYGLRQMMGSDLKPLLNQVYMRFARSDEAKRIIRNYFPNGSFNASNSNHRQTVGEELLAHLAETNQHPKLWNRIVSAVREGLRKLGFTLKLSKADLLNILRGAQRTVEQGGISRPSMFDTQFRRAYHGTPHRFDKFSLEAMGTGEGNQAYGWGLYFAGNRQIAEYYQETLSNSSQDAAGESDTIATYKGKAASTLADGPAKRAAYAMQESAGDYDTAIERMEAQGNPESAQMLRDDLAAWQSGQPSDFDVEQRPRGNLYEVEIPDDSDLLDWDKPLSEQPKEVLRKLREYADLEGGMIAELMQPMEMGSTTGASVYRALASKSVQEQGNGADHAQYASKRLSFMGIPGLRYLDGSSRHQGEGSHNYVIWDEDVVTVQAVNDEIAQAEAYFSRDGVESDNDIPLPDVEEITDETEAQRIRDQYGQGAGESEVSGRSLAGGQARPGWREQTQVRNSRGEPAVIFRGSARELSLADFDASSRGQATGHPSAMLGTFFTTSDRDAQRYGSVAAYQLDLRNPYVIEGSELPGFESAQDAERYRADLEAQGYDGIVIDYTDLGGPQHIVPFAAESVIVPDTAMFSRTDDGIPTLDQDAFGPPSNTLVRRAVSKIADKFTVLKGVQDQIRKNDGAIPEQADAYMAEELFHGKVENDIRLVRERMIEPLTEKMAEYEISLKQLDEFLYALHAPERNRVIAERNPQMPDGGSGMTNAEAAEVVNRVKESGKLTEYRDLAARVHRMLEMRRNILRSAGLLDGETLGAWEASYKAYVPLKGYATDEAPDGRPRIGKGFAIAGKESQMAGGRKSKAASPVANTISDLSEAILRQRKNEVGQTFLNLVQMYPNDSYWKVYTDENPEVERKPVRVKDPETGRMKVEVREQTVPMAMMSDRYFTTKVNGKTHYIKIEDERLMNAMRNIGPDNNNILVRSLAAVTRVMSSLNTSYNPEFVISNFSRDIQTALLNLTSEQSSDDGKARGTKIAAKTLKDVPTSIRAINASLKGRALTGKAAEWQKHFDQFRADGAKTGWFDMKDVDGQMKDMEKLVKLAQGGTVSNLRKTFRAVTDWVENTNGAIENGVRLSAYVNAIDAGIPRAQAASLAKNMTVNFNRRGELGTTLNAVYMFANASVQGTNNFVRTLGRLNGHKGDRIWRRMNAAQKIAAGMAVGGFMLSLMNRLGAGEDDDGVNWWDKVPDYIKERNIVIMKSLVGGEPGEYWTIPLPYGYNIFPVIGTQAEHLAFSENQSSGDAAGNVVLAALGSFSPIGFEESNEAYGTIIKNVTPTILRPIASISLNENFMGGPIFKENHPFGTPKPDSSLNFRSTPEAFKILAQKINEATGGNEQMSGAADWSPDVMQYLVAYYGGGAYDFFTSRTPNFVGKLTTGVELEDREIPFWRKLQGKVLPYEDQSLFYDRRDEINQLVGRWEALKGAERGRFARDYRDKLRLKPLMDSTEKRLRNLRKQRDRIEMRDDLSLAEKDERLQEIEQRVKREIDRFNERYNEADD